MLILLYLGLTILASIVLIKSVNLFIDSTTKIAQHAGISAYTISFLLVAVATSLPETVVGITSAIEKNPILAYGNAIGSNIALLTLIIALPVLIGKGISTRHVIHSKDIYYSALFSSFPIVLINDGVLTMLDGLLLLTGYVFYTLAVLRRSTRLERLRESFEHPNIWKQSVIFAVSLGLLLAASELIVRSTISISTELGWALGFVGLTITAIGTSLPEIAFVVGSIEKENQDDVLGDIIGSVVANSTFVLGITSLIHPIKLDGSNFSVSTTFFMILTLLVFIKFAKSREKFDRREGFILLCLYILFVAVEYHLQATVPTN